MLGQVIHRRAKSNRFGDGRRAGFEFVRELVGHKERSWTRLIISPPPRKGGMLPAAPCPYSTPMPGRAAHLVRRKGQEIHIQGLHIHREMRDGLRAIHQGDRPGFVRQADDLAAGLIVPSTLDMCVNETSFGCELQQASGMRPDPAAHLRVTGMNSSRRFFSAASMCQGTRLEWCSISVRMTRSPGVQVGAPQVYATRLIDSVVLRV